MADLKTNYLGLNLANPIVPSASPLSHSVENIRKLQNAGASAVVLYSLFEEQITYDSQLLNETLEQGTNTFAESLNYLPEMSDYNVGPEKYLKLIEGAKKSVTIPIIASLNGSTLGGWAKYAKNIEQAGADALELNIYRLPTNTSITEEELKNEYLEIVSSVLESISIPLSVKISPFFGSIPAFANRLAQEGVKGLVVFNRFYQADIDLENLELMHRVNYSTSADLLLPLRWAAVLYSQTTMDIAITTGVHTHEDVLKSIMAGANVTMMASELLVNGVSRISEILKSLNKWMDEHEYASIKQMCGSMSLRNVADPEKYERAQYLRVLDSYKPESAQMLASK